MVRTYATNPSTATIHPLFGEAVGSHGDRWRHQTGNLVAATSIVGALHASQPPLALPVHSVGRVGVPSAANGFAYAAPVAPDAYVPLQNGFAQHHHFDAAPHQNGFGYAPNHQPVSSFGSDYHGQGAYDNQRTVAQPPSTDQRASRNMSYMDVERDLKARQRDQQRQYYAELQSQIAQNRQRPRSRSATVRNRPMPEAIAAQRRPAEEPYWFSSNPQPKTGVRAAQQWQTAQNGRQPDQSQQFHSPTAYPLPAPSGYSNTYADPYSSQQFMPSAAYQPPIHYGAQQQGGPTYLLTNGHAPVAEKRQPTPQWDPFGKGGSGAPMRDRDGRVVTDRRKMHGAWSGAVDTNMPHDSGNSSLSQSLSGPSFRMPAADLQSNIPYAAPPAMPTNSSFAQAAVGARDSQHDSYRRELMEQIEERKRQKEFEKQRQREEDERDRLRVEKDATKVRREMEDDKRKQQEKQQAAEKRRIALAEQARQAQIEADRKNPPRRRGQQMQEDVDADEPAQDGGLEWWERRGNRRSPSATSAVIPTMRAAQPSAAAPVNSTKRPARQPSRPQSTVSSSEPVAPRPTTGLSEAPSRPHSSVDGSSTQRSALRRNDGVMRQLSAMRERLAREQERVQSALNRNEYGDDVFSDNEAPRRQMRRQPSRSADLEQAPSLIRRSKSGHGGGNVRAPSRYDGLFDGATTPAPKERTPRTVQSRRRASVRSRRADRGVLSDSDDDDSARTARSRPPASRRSTTSKRTLAADQVVDDYLNQREARHRD